jgi:hypothetical protein
MSKHFPCHHGTTRPQVTDGEDTMDMENECVYIGLAVPGHALLWPFPVTD